ncbi:MAG: hypothetical protein JW913_17030 [Chitinispirillaceae bacterium]|nr:hypothetical protein [Chitinispirillaceae bacterium]
MRKTSCFTLLFIIAVSNGRATQLYIDPVSGSDDYGGASEAQAWKTITRANQALVPGDTVFIKAGTYTAYIAPKNSGTSSQPIVYTNSGTDTVTIRDAVYGINLDGKSYITVQGIAFRNLDRFLYVRNRSSHNTFAHCTFDSARMTDGKTATWAGSVISGSSQHNRILNCRFSNYGYFTDDDKSCILDIGNEEGRTDSTCFNLIEESLFFHAGHHVMGVYGKYNVIRSNYFHNEPWSMGTAASDRGAVLYGDRNLSFSGYSENGGRTLFEGNRVGYSADPSDNNGASGMAMNSSDNIVRFNSYFHNISAGLSMSLTSSYLQDILRNKVYNNSFFDNGHNPYDSIDHMSSGIGFGIYSGSLIIKDNELKNNVLYKHKLTFGEYNINTSARTGIMAVQLFANNWDGDSRGDPLFVNAPAGPGDPMDSAAPDLHLKEGSPCIDSGTYLTTIVSPGGSGTSFQVKDAGYFMDGWGIEGVAGDEIQLFGTTDRARITNVNYISNTLTVDKSLTWTENQGVCLKYEGAAPDIGAYEYGAAEVVVPAIRARRQKMQHQTYGVYDFHGRKVRIDGNIKLITGSAVTHLRPGIYLTVSRRDNTRMVRKLAVMR